MLGIILLLQLDLKCAQAINKWVRKPHYVLLAHYVPGPMLIAEYTIVNITGFSLTLMIQSILLWEGLSLPPPGDTSCQDSSPWPVCLGWPGRPWLRASPSYTNPSPRRDCDPWRVLMKTDSKWINTIKSTYMCLHVYINVYIQTHWSKWTCNCERKREEIKFREVGAG